MPFRCGIALLAVAVVLTLTGSAGLAHVRPGTCLGVKRNKHLEPGNPRSVYLTPHGCAYLSHPALGAIGRPGPGLPPPKIHVRVHGAVRAFVPPTQRAIPGALGWCGPHFFTLRWPHAIFIAAQLIPDRNGVPRCSNALLWIADLAKTPVISWVVYRNT